MGCDRKSERRDSARLKASLAELAGDAKTMKDTVKTLRFSKTVDSEIKDKLQMVQDLLGTVHRRLKVVYRMAKENHEKV